MFRIRGAARPHPARPIVASLVLLLVMAAVSCDSSPIRPSPTPAWRDLDTFGILVGTNWTGTATSTTTTGGRVTVPVSLLFLWSGVCDVPGWCAEGYHPFGWGTTDGVRTRIRGAQTGTGYWRSLDVGNKLQSILGDAEGSGHWERARLSGDSQRLEVVSSDFEWREWRGVTYELTRAPWPDFPCPQLVSCGPR